MTDDNGQPRQGPFLASGLTSSQTHFDGILDIILPYARL